MTPYLIVLCTVPDKETGRKITEVLLNSRLAACVNLMPQMNSRYWWNQRIESEKEHLLIIKTRRSLFSELEKTILHVHPYDVPEILALPVMDGSGAYLDWIKSETSE